MFQLIDLTTNDVIRKFASLRSAETYFKNLPDYKKDKIEIIERTGLGNKGQRRGLYNEHKKKFPNNHCAQSVFYKRRNERGTEKAINTPALPRGRPRKDIFGDYRYR